MKGFKWTKDFNGHPNVIEDTYYVPDATAIEKGEPVNFTQGTGIIVLAAPTTLAARITGVSTLEKVANDGVTSLTVSNSPTAVYKYHCNKAYTLTGGSTTTAVESSLQPNTDDVWIGGAIEIVTCAADSDLIGRHVTITDSDEGTGTLTLAETLPAALASGDTIHLCPGYMLKDSVVFDLTSDSMDVDFDSDGGSVMRIVGSNPDTMDMFVQFEASEVNA